MIHKLQCRVNKFIRLIINLNYRSVTYVMKENEIMSVEQLFKFETANFMYQHFNNLPLSVFEPNFDRNILKCNTVIPRYIALHLSRLRGIFYSAFFTVNPDWLRGFTVV